jgi:hypothetical protein
MILRWLAHISRFGLAGLFLFAVGAKIYSLSDHKMSFFTNMSGLVPERWAIPAAVAVMLVEVIAVALLVRSRTARVGGVWTAALLISFAGYALYYRFGLNNVEGLECGCFGGIISSQLGVTTALRNLALLLPTVLVIVGMKKSRGQMSNARY